MSIRTVLLIKIYFTLLIILSFWLLIIVDTFVDTIFLTTETQVLLLLLSFAYLSLVFVYYNGINRLKMGESINDVLWTGVISNLSAGVILLFNLILGNFTSFDGLTFLPYLIWPVAIILLALAFGIYYIGLHSTN
ncbi:MAG: hypothetical protein INQ03_13640 [Candidatus Heimdallarchaeota archaeon]|nr:hypothetical protein [Candidatus Heimdallarchaeota archaeon]